MAVRSGKIRSSTKTFAKIGDDQNLRPRSTGHHVVHHKIQCGFPRFSPPSAILIFRRDPNFVENSQRFWKESPKSSKTSETTLEFCTRVPKQRAPNLHTCKTCQTCQLRETCKTCVAGLHTVCNRLQQCRYKGEVGAANAAPRGRTSSYIGLGLG